MVIKFGGDKYMLHRIVYYLYYEINPEQCHVDHIDRNPLNNQKSNLRLATYAHQNINTKTRSDNTSGHRGVFW
jgi:hypothetical protein